MTLITPSDRFAIFGARGMAGSAISRALDSAGYQQLLKPSRQELDLLDLSAVQQWFSDNKPTIVVLAAAKVGGINANNTYPTDFLLENIKIQTNVIETAWRSGVRRLLFLGSSCIYPQFAEQPIKEASLLTGALEPTNEWYAIAKISGIKLCEALRIQHGFDAISLMPTNLYGPGDYYHPSNSHVLPALVRRFYEATETKAKNVVCWGSGKALREFLHVDDLANACLFILRNWSPPSSENSFINVGTGKDITIKELAELISEATGFTGTIHWDTTKPDGTPKKQLDISRLTKLGWSPRISLHQGLADTISMFRENYRSGDLRL